MEQIRKEINKAVEELLKIAKLEKNNIFVLGCSTSEIVGSHIGKGSVPQIGELIVTEIKKVCEKNLLFFAVQCCEHLNRALVVEKECMEKYNLEQVSVVPQIHAGGSAATAAMKSFKQPVVIERIQAYAGIDIGDTFIGMHLKSVVVPVRLGIKKIGKAHLTAARTRPKLIGGERAKYNL